MRALVILSVLAIGFVSFHVSAEDSGEAAVQAVPTDGFGAPFYAQTPVGLGDFSVEDQNAPLLADADDASMDDIAAQLQEILPAAGVEEISDVVVDEMRAVSDDGCMPESE